MKGGYRLINCKGLNLLAESAQTINGLYAEVMNAYKYGKPIFAENLKWGTTHVSPVQVFLVPFDDYVVATASTLQVIVTSDDSVVINNMAPQG